MKGEAGAVGLIGAAMAVLVVIVSLLVVDLGRVAAARAHVSTAADAAALAAAPVTFFGFGANARPDAAAAELAEANGAYVVVCRCGIDRSWAPRTVVVTVGQTLRLSLLGDREMVATAAAEFRPILLVER
ncbi:MAG: hypothetical protein GY722_24190 [bacterium]|nr:hypothetical protein [bacterium]